MEFDVNKLDGLVLSKSRKIDVKLSQEEIEFMSNIYNTIINSEDYESTTRYLAGIYGMSISDIKYIRNVYYNKFASKEEKIEYYNKMKTLKKEIEKKDLLILGW